MQTFLPYQNYSASARVLDNKRLGKQRVECLQILKALTLPDYGWQNHPAVKMWRGSEHSLFNYSYAICEEWLRRGFKDTCRFKMVEAMARVQHPTQYPRWMGDESIHASHRSNLLRKDPTWYGQFNWSETTDLAYVWPV